MQIEIVGPDGEVHYRRPWCHPLIIEALKRPGYSIRFEPTRNLPRRPDGHRHRREMSDATPEEKAIYDAMLSVSAAGSNKIIDEAVILLGSALDKFADFVAMRQLNEMSRRDFGCEQLHVDPVINGHAAVWINGRQCVVPRRATYRIIASEAGFTDEQNPYIIFDANDGRDGTLLDGQWVVCIGGERFGVQESNT